MKFSVCIAAIRPATVNAAIASIRRQSWPDWELIVVGQGPDRRLQEVGEAAAREDRRIHYLHLDCCGAALACNAALKCATGEIVAFIDDDCEARADWLARLEEYFRADPQLGIVGGAILPPRPARRGLAVCPSLEPVELVYNPLTGKNHKPADWLWASANVALRRSVIERVGEFDEYLGPGAPFPAADDLDYLLRAEAAGIKMCTTPHAVVYHTYGYRYGWRAVFQHKKNYASGNGAMAGKLTLLHDPRGRQWLEMTVRACTVDKLRKFQLHRLPTSLLGLWYYTRAYHRCLRNYRVHSTRGVLVPHP